MDKVEKAIRELEETIKKNKEVLKKADKLLKELRGEKSPYQLYEPKRNKI